MSLWQLKACEQPDPNEGPDAPTPEEHDALVAKAALLH